MIEFKNIEIKFGDFIAIPDLSMEIKKGEFFTLLGPSGCGKTTTLRALVGFNIPTKGEIFVERKDITNTAVENREIGMVFQSYALFPTMTVFENIAFGLKVKKENREVIEEKVRDIADKVELDEQQLNKKVSELSGGQQQRVAIARALVLKPKILVLDEPLSNLDAKLRKQLRMELKELQRKFGITTIYVTHDQEEALTLSDRIAIFNKGVIEQIGTPYEVYNKSATEFVCNFIGDVNKLDKGFINTKDKEMIKGFDENLPIYIRTEKITSNPITENIKFLTVRAEVTDKEFYGAFTKYTFKVQDYIIKNIERESGRKKYEIGEVINLYIKETDILQFR